MSLRKACILSHPLAVQKEATTLIRRSPSVTRQSFTIMPNVSLNDTRLSWEAKGMLAYLISKPDHWEIIVGQLVKESPNAKKRKVLVILKELESLGYITNNGQIVYENGDFGHTERIVHEVAISIIPDGGVVPSSVHARSVDAASVHAEAHHIVSTDVKQVLLEVSTDSSNFASPEKSGDGHETEKKSPKAKKPKPTYTNEFEEVWENYPRKVAKNKAYENFVTRMRTGASFSELLEATQNYAATRRGEPEAYTLHGSTFFGSSLRYKDFLYDGEGLAEANRPRRTKTFSDIEEFLMRGED